MIILETDNLAKTYAIHPVFSGLSFRAESSVIGIAGENGSGKSTLLKCLAGLLKPTAGTVHWATKSGSLSKEALKNILGFSAPYIQLYEELTVLENLDFIIRARGGSKQAGASALLQSLGAAALGDAMFGELSTGQQQRAKLAAALIHNPKILMMDEPGSNLDKRGRQNIKEITERFRRQGAMVLIASNQTAELDLCDTILDLNSQVYKKGFSPD